MPLEFIKAMVRGFIANREFVRQQLAAIPNCPVANAMWRSMPPVAPCMETWLSLQHQRAGK